MKLTAGSESTGPEEEDHTGTGVLHRLCQFIDYVLFPAGRLWASETTGGGSCRVKNTFIHQNCSVEPELTRAQMNTMKQKHETRF